MRHTLLIAMLLFTVRGHACRLDTDCEVGSVCSRATHAEYGTCSGGGDDDNGVIRGPIGMQCEQDHDCDSGRCAAPTSDSSGTERVCE